MWLTIFSDLLRSIVSYYSIEAHCVVYIASKVHTSGPASIVLEVENLEHK